MPFNNIDSPGNRRDRRAVAALQRANGAADRKAAAQEKRQRKAAREFERMLDRTIVFFATPEGGVRTYDPDGAYLSKGFGAMEGKYQIIVAGKMKATAAHYVKAISTFVKSPVKLVSNELMEVVIPADQLWDGKEFRSIIVEVI